MYLTPRQERFYQHRVDIYAPTTALDANGEPTTVYTLSARAVPCHIEKNQSGNIPSAGGRLEYDISLSKDTVHFPIEAMIDDTYWFQNVTIDRYGRQSTAYGRWWVIQGEPKTIESLGVRDANKKAVTAIQQKEAPDGIPL